MGQAFNIRATSSNRPRRIRSRNQRKDCLKEEQAVNRADRRYIASRERKKAKQNASVAGNRL